LDLIFVILVAFVALVLTPWRVTRLQMIPIIEEAALRKAITPQIAVDVIREAFRADGEGAPTSPRSSISRSPCGTASST
jgi:hypothetical protein